MVTELSKMCHRKTESTKLSLVTITMTLRLCIHDIFFAFFIFKGKLEESCKLLIMCHGEAYKELGHGKQ